MTFIIRYELAVGDQIIADGLVCLANSREQASERILSVLAEQYGEQAVLLSLDISRGESEEEQEHARYPQR